MGSNRKSITWGPSDLQKSDRHTRASSPQSVISPEYTHTHFQSTMSLPADVQSALREAFDMFDADKDGRVTHKELAQVLQKLKINANMDTLMGMIKKVDTDNSGTVEFNEFDNDGNGYIEADELRQKLEEMSGEAVTEAEVADMIKQVDMDGDGKINYEEFKKLMAEE